MISLGLILKRVRNSLDQTLRMQFPKRDYSSPMILRLQGIRIRKERLGVLVLICMFQMISSKLKR
jgi:hypothetical protein